jgi:WD40 repeat protein/DNA-binding SARP family transcriptional activator
MVDSSVVATCNLTPVVPHAAVGRMPDRYQPGISVVDGWSRQVESRVMGITVLGPLQVEGSPNGLSPRDRVVLSALVVYARRPVSTEALADALWGDALPASWTKVVYGCVWRLRKVLGAAAIQRVPAGYRLSLVDDELDHRVFERLVERGRNALDEDDPPRALFLVEEALGLWRGQALADLEEWEPGRAEAARLDGLRMDAEELRIEATVRTGRASTVLEQARILIAEAPFRERRWALLATALYQCGRQAEALGTVQRARAMLVGELGLDPGVELVELEKRLLTQDRSLSADVSGEPSQACPYRGLLPYDAEHADSFFGREDDVASCLRRLRDTGVLVVIGPSGVGKSSLVCAGVVASLSRTDTPVVTTRPGVHPLESLGGLKPRGRQTLVVDQAEEAVTLCADAGERKRYFTALAAHVGAGGGLVVSLRADHLGDLAPYPEIARILEDGLYLLGPMGEPDLRRAIEAPARGAGLKLEPGLVDLLVREADGEPAGLPMLSHVLRETWERREGATLTVRGYKGTGGIQHAVSQSAEMLYDALDATQRAQLRGLLLRLVMPTDAGDPVRTKVPRDKVAVDDDHARLIEQLVEARLVSIDGDAVQIAHEALVRVWPRLRRWLDDDLDGQRLFRHLAEAADAWHLMGRPDSELYRGARLTRTLEWRDRAQPDLNDTESAFLEASEALSAGELRDAEERARHQRRVNRRLRAALTGVAVLAVVAVIAGSLAVRTSDRAGQDRDRARAAADIALARQAGAVARDHENLSASLLLALSALKLDTSAPAWDTLADALIRATSVLALRDPGGVVVDLTASPDGRLLALSRPGEDSGLLLLDAQSLMPLPFADDTPASGIAFSPDSSVLAMAVNHWTGNTGAPSRIDPQPIRLYDMPGGALADRQLGGFPEGASTEYALDFSADGKRLVAAVDRLGAAGDGWIDTSAFVWDLADPSRPVFRAKLPADYPILKLSPDGKRLYVVTDGDPVRPVRVYDVDSRRLVASRRSAALRRVGDFAGALSPDGSTLAVGAGRRVLLVDTETLRLADPGMRTDTGDSMERIEYSDDGSRLAAATGNGRVLVWDTATGVLTHRLVEGGSPQNLDFSSDGRTLFSDGTAWDLTGERGFFAAGKASDLAEYAVSTPAPDGRTIVRERAGHMWFVDNTSGRETRRLRKRQPDSHHVWSPDSRKLLSWRDSGTLRLWDTTTGTPIAQRRISGAVAPTFSDAGDEVYVNVLEEQTLLVLDARTLTPSRTPIDLTRPVLGVARHPDDESLLAFGHDGSVLRVHTETGLVRPVAPAGTFPVARTWEAEVSPDGTRILGLNPDEDAQLAHVATWERFGAGADRDERSGTFDLSPDGSQFAALAGDAIALFDGVTGARQATIALPAVPPEAQLTYLPDSSGLLVAGVDGTTWTVDTRLSSWVDRACAIAGRNLTRDEWQDVYPDRPYEATCPQWPSPT